MARSRDIDIIRDSLLMAMQDLDDPNLTKEERDGACKVAMAKASLASSYARIQKNVIDAEKLRQEYMENEGSNFILGEERNPLALERRSV